MSGDALKLIADERRRQVEAEGWTPEHDDEHSGGEMAQAAACYAFGHDELLIDQRIGAPISWPWAADWWKPSPENRVRDLVKAGALIVAEIERIQRAEQTPMNPNMPSSGRVDVADTIRTLATIVRLHEGNRDEQVNALLQRSEDCAAAVAELIAERDALLQENESLRNKAAHWDDLIHARETVQKDSDDCEWKQLASRRQLIEAIKSCRAAHGLSLREAKDCVEGYIISTRGAAP